MVRANTTLFIYYYTGRTLIVPRVAQTKVSPAWRQLTRGLHRPDVTGIRVSNWYRIARMAYWILFWRRVSYMPYVIGHHPAWRSDIYEVPVFCEAWKLGLYVRSWPSWSLNGCTPQSDGFHFFFPVGTALGRGKGGIHPVRLPHNF